MNESVFGWHFVGDTLRDGRPVPADGEWLDRDGDLVMCAAGYHGSERIIDALQYAPGSTICWCEFGGEIERGADKLAARRRKILWRVDGSEIMREFACWCALSVIDLWNAPDVVREYLEMAREDLRIDARDAARAALAAAWAAGAAAWPARAAAGAARATWAAAWAAWDAGDAGAATWAAAWAAWAAWSAAWDAWDAGDAGDAAWAAWDAAWAARAAWAAAWDAWDAGDAGAAWDAQNEQLERMVREAHAAAEEQ